MNQTAIISNNLQCTPEIKTFEYSTHEHKVKTANQVQSTFSQSLSLPLHGDIGSPHV